MFHPDLKGSDIDRPCRCMHWKHIWDFTQHTYSNCLIFSHACFPALPCLHLAYPICTAVQPFSASLISFITSPSEHHLFPHLKLPQLRRCFQIPSFYTLYFNHFITSSPFSHREVVETLTQEILKVRLDGDPSCGFLFIEGKWTRWPLKLPSNSYDSMKRRLLEEPMRPTKPLTFAYTPGLCQSALSPKLSTYN